MLTKLMAAVVMTGALWVTGDAANKQLGFSLPGSLCCPFSCCSSESSRCYSGEVCCDPPRECCFGETPTPAKPTCCSATK